MILCPKCVEKYNNPRYIIVFDIADYTDKCDECGKTLLEISNFKYIVGEKNDNR